MSSLEKTFGNIMAGVLLLIFMVSIVYSIFSLVFRDGRGMSLYGGRGQSYMAE
jgi:hypothetical protein